jgi:hypothetical protein
LHYCASDEKERKRINAEIEAWETYQELLESSEKDYVKKIEQQETALAEKEVALERERAEKEAALERERAAIAEKEALLAELARLKTLNRTPNLKS